MRSIFMTPPKQDEQRSVPWSQVSNYGDHVADASHLRPYIIPARQN